MYDNSSPSIREFVFILNDSGDHKVYQEAEEVVRQKFDSHHIFQIPMTNTGVDKIEEAGEDRWYPFMDLDLRLLG
eukprot:CAMPEP_0116871874 /NCGR_PEP_ID=MMETSP0463-20121206/2408_1 /TAXON_ID=181622 /ORGANISM="Strombidinopsis sp, Strain SopsisLIS2011" /LENGTH=74 /DNA_ID=CAMNT_0004511099 /DNA_START=557 /DNA_END=781 /DNA_ORIENTATION=+